MTTARMTTRLFGAVVAASAIAALSLSPSAPATGGLASTWASLYPTSASLSNANNCNLCHSSGSFSSNFNSYGKDIMDQLDGGASESEAIAMVESLDSDADPTGSTNLEEIDADTQPGWTPGPNNTTWSDGEPSENQEPVPGISGDLDPTLCTGDIDGNGTVGFSDLTLLLAAWGPCPAPPATCDADIDTSGTVGFSDLTILLAAWGECP